MRSARAPTRYLRLIDGDHAWRRDGLPVFEHHVVGQDGQERKGGDGHFPIWSSCVLRHGNALQSLFRDWENPWQGTRGPLPGMEDLVDQNQFIPLGDAPLPDDTNDPYPPQSTLTSSGPPTRAAQERCSSRATTLSRSRPPTARQAGPSPLPTSSSVHGFTRIPPTLAPSSRRLRARCSTSPGQTGRTTSTTSPRTPATLRNGPSAGGHARVGPGVAERFVGTVRRELLDHLIVLDDRHLRRLLGEYIGYYLTDRTHLGLEKDAPVVRLVEPRPAGATGVDAGPRVGGLHHRYSWRAAA